MIRIKMRGTKKTQYFSTYVLRRIQNMQNTVPSVCTVVFNTTDFYNYTLSSSCLFIPTFDVCSAASLTSPSLNPFLIVMISHGFQTRILKLPAALLHKCVCVFHFCIWK